MPKQKNLAQYEQRLLRVLSYIYENLDGDLSLDTLAAVANMSRFHWHRVFSAMTGETISDLIKRLRLNRAANILVLDDCPVSEVAKQVGYRNVSGFSRAFSHAHGTPPAEFRTRGKQVSNQLLNSTAKRTPFPVVMSRRMPKQAAGVLHKGSYTKIGAAFQKLGGILASRSLFEHVSGLFVIYHDAPGSKAPSEMSAHVAVEIGDCFPGSLDELDYFELAGGNYATMQHQGSYATLKAAYTWLYGTWLPGSGHEARDAPPIEFYVNDPKTTPTAELRTDILVPLQ
ncbi:MAG: AraC family transcriptional regulator [Pseudomonadota bacterium]